MYTFDFYSQFLCSAVVVFFFLKRDSIMWRFFREFIKLSIKHLNKQTAKQTILKQEQWLIDWNRYIHGRKWCSFLVENFDSFATIHAHNFSFLFSCASTCFVFVLRRYLLSFKLFHQRCESCQIYEIKWSRRFLLVFFKNV